MNSRDGESGDHRIPADDASAAGADAVVVAVDAVGVGRDANGCGDAADVGADEPTTQPIHYSVEFIKIRKRKLKKIGIDSIGNSFIRFESSF